MNYIITKNQEFFNKIGKYNFCDLEALMLLPNKIAVDTETTGLQARHCDLFCIQIGTGKDNYIIDLYSSVDCHTFYHVIPYLIGKTMIFHNALFDLGFMYQYNFYPTDVLDTMLASKILLNGKEDSDNWYAPYRHDFGAVMKREIDAVYDKTDQKNIHIVKLSQPSTIEYSFNDVDRTS